MSKRKTISPAVKAATQRLLDKFGPGGPAHVPEPEEAILAAIREKLAECERKAWLSLAGYKFIMFGYWAAQWVLCKGLMPHHVRNPFKSLVDFAKEECKRRGWLTNKGEDDAD